ncbi:MAG: transcriptional regulator, AraC family [Ignavibacteria bacterium]|nr:transcriptional regulator, AraC family [Ignavibacteria bacterium]
MKLFIKNMVCIRCKMVVQSELEKLGIRYSNLILGEVEILESFSQEQFEKLDVGLRAFGLELMIDKRAKLIEKIKNIIIEIIHYSEEELKINFSAYLSEHLNYDYTYLSNLFSEVHGTTIEHFIIHQKIERVKEMLVYNEFTLSEIAWKLHYSSVQHLSSQFRKVTGLTPSFFKKISIKRRTEINNM